MRTPSRPLTQHLSPTGHDKHLRRCFSGTLSEERAQQSRHQRLGLWALWCSPEPLRVAPSADELGSGSWAEQWTCALEEEVGGLEARLVPGGRRGR